MRIVATLAMAATFGLSVAQAAPVSHTDTHLYGTASGHIDPGGNDALNPTFVRVSDNSTSRFNDRFDFSSSGCTTINSVTLTLNYTGAGPGLLPLELWAVRVLGSNNPAATDDYFGGLVDILSPTSHVLTLASDVLDVDAFANTLTTETLAFWFSEFTPGTDVFRRYSARIDIAGDLAAAVPLPAGGLLLLAGLGGLAALRRRRAV